MVEWLTLTNFPILLLKQLFGVEVFRFMDVSDEGVECDGFIMHSKPAPKTKQG